MLYCSYNKKTMCDNQTQHFPCLHCHPHSYIRMVHSLIERCLLLHMDKDQCVKALAEHARIRPLVTLTVWNELMKENQDFFQSYHRTLSPRPYSNGDPDFFRNFIIPVLCLLMGAFGFMLFCQIDMFKGEDEKKNEAASKR